MIYSFAPEFRLCVDTWLGRPRLSIRDAQGRRYTKAEFAELESVTVMAAWKMFPSVLRAAKRFVFMSQAQRYLAELHINATVAGDELYINLSGYSACRLKTEERHWQLFFFPVAPLVPVTQEPAAVIQGRYAARCSLIIAHLVLWGRAWRGTQFHLLELMQGWPLTWTWADIEHQQVFLTIRNKFMILSFRNSLKSIAFDSYRQRCTVESTFAPCLELDVPGAGMLRQFRPKFDPGSHHVPDFTAFLHQVTIPILRLADFFADASSRWSIMPIPQSRLSVAFCLVYRRKFTLSCHVRSAVPCLMFVSKRPPSGFLACGLRELQPALVARRPTEDYLFRLRLEQFARVKILVETFCDILASIATEWALDFASSDLELSADGTTLVVHRKIAGQIVQMSMSGLSVSWSLQGNNGALNTLSGKASSSPAFIAAAAHLIIVLLPADQPLFNDVLLLMVRIADEVGLGPVCEAMDSAMIQPNGRPRLSFPGEDPFVVELPWPYTPPGQLTITWASGIEKSVRGLDSILRILRG
jgi:hypothetical protein